MVGMLKQTLTPIIKIQMVRQLLGAAGGTLVALTLYTAYQAGSDFIRGSLMNDVAPVEVAAETKTVKYTDEQREENIRRVGVLARAAFERLEANEVH